MRQVPLSREQRRDYHGEDMGTGLETVFRCLCLGDDFRAGRRHAAQGCASQRPTMDAGNRGGDRGHILAGGRKLYSWSERARARADELPS
jgi:hypothetical protein